MQYFLDGLKVLDFTNNIAGPTAASLCAEHGAEVIKIEKPVLGDDSRYYTPTVDGVGATFMWTNRGKKSVVLNLKDPRAKEAIYRLVEDADILIESYRPGVMDKLGLGYEKLSEINPRLIYCSVSAFGHKGPYQERAGYDIIAQAFSGIIYRTGQADGPPTKISFPIGDTTAAMNAFGSIALALYHRTKTGKGQYIDISLARTLLWNYTLFTSTVDGPGKTRMGNHDGTLCPYGVFEGPNNEHLIIGAANASTWKKLCAAMQQEELADDPRYVSNVCRVARREEVINLVERWLKSQPSVDAAQERLAKYQVPCCKVYAEADILRDPHAWECGWISNIPVPSDVKKIDYFVGPLGLADFSVGKIRNLPAPGFGEHNHEVLERCGFTSAEVDEMESQWATTQGND